MMLNTKSVHKLGLCPTCNQLDQIGGGETSNQPLVGERIKSDWSKPLLKVLNRIRGLMMWQTLK